MRDKFGGVISLRRERLERELKEFGAGGVIIGGDTNCPCLAIARETECECFISPVRAFLQLRAAAPCLASLGTRRH